jgi:uncharacterized protein with von Willebrand factor type A (vWA) domain
VSPPQPPERVGYTAVSDKSPHNFDGQLLSFAEDLRTEGLAVGTSEILDAFEALSHVAWTQREDFKEALAATLA